MKKKDNWNFVEWYDIYKDDTNLLPTGIDGQTAFDIIVSYLLDEDEQTIVDPLCTSQTNTEFIFRILSKHSKRFRKEMQRFIKKHSRK